MVCTQFKCGDYGFLAAFAEKPIITDQYSQLATNTAYIHPVVIV